MKRETGGVAALWPFASMLLLMVIGTIGAAMAATTAVPLAMKGVEDAQYWRTVGEAQLKRTLKLDGNMSKLSAARNIILFIGDGMGMATITAGRILKGQMQGRQGEDEQLAFDGFPYVGLSKTYNVDKQVPDSAGTATAMFTGVKTLYGSLSMDATVPFDGRSIESGRLASFIEWGLDAGKRAGLVTTTRLTHATPAALYAQTPNRNRECDADIPAHMKDTEKDIARQLIEQSPGNRMHVVLAGGGSPMGMVDDGKWPSYKDMPKFGGAMETPCFRKDGRNLVDEWMQIDRDNSSFVRNTAELLNVDRQEVDRLLGLFALNHMSYSSLRDKSPSGEPSLKQMTIAALEVLQRDSGHGFVLMVEGGRIDHAHHQNHARLALQEFVELEKAVQAAYDKTNPAETLIIVTADHSHALTLNGYPVRGNDILGFANKPEVEPYETLTYANGPGFNTHRAAPEMETNENRTLAKTWIRVEQMTSAERAAPTYRHQAMLPLDDETHGGEDVPVYATGPGSQLVRGTFEQNYIAYVLSYAGCMGPVGNWNQGCNDDGSRKSSASLSRESVFVFASTLFVLAQNYAY